MNQKYHIPYLRNGYFIKFIKFILPRIINNIKRRKNFLYHENESFCYRDFAKTFYAEPASPPTHIVCYGHIRHHILYLTLSNLVDTVDSKIILTLEAFDTKIKHNWFKNENII